LQKLFAVLSSQIPENLPCSVVSRILLFGALSALWQVLAHFTEAVFRLDGHVVVNVRLANIVIIFLIARYSYHNLILTSKQ
jgi:hypothetical protein